MTRYSLLKLGHNIKQATDPNLYYRLGVENVYHGHVAPTKASLLSANFDVNAHSLDYKMYKQYKPFIEAKRKAYTEKLESIGVPKEDAIKLAEKKYPLVDKKDFNQVKIIPQKKKVEEREAA